MNFQYTASLAGSIMDDWMRYEELEDGDTTAWAARVNYAAKISNFNAINMGQISDKYVGNVSWRYNMYKGGYGAMNVNDGGTRVMNNGWPRNVSKASISKRIPPARWSGSPGRQREETPTLSTCWASCTLPERKLPMTRNEPSAG